ncbi:hypothetical protein C5167_026008 [Papaver somniferum]|nr:hypothetical protein C5167_026008 [Papaver somniferum]
MFGAFNNFGFLIVIGSAKIAKFVYLYTGCLNNPLQMSREGPAFGPRVVHGGGLLTLCLLTYPDLTSLSTWRKNEKASEIGCGPKLRGGTCDWVRVAQKNLKVWLLEWRIGES